MDIKLFSNAPKGYELPIEAEINALQLKLCYYASCASEKFELANKLKEELYKLDYVASPVKTKDDYPIVTLRDLYESNILTKPEYDFCYVIIHSQYVENHP